MGRKDYSEEQAAFMAWLCMTKEEKTSIYGDHLQGTFAIHHGLPHVKILSEWKKNPKFKKQYQDAFLETFKNKLPEARNTLLDRAISDGDVNALKEVFKISGMSIERVQNISSDDVQFVVTSVIETAQDVLSNHPDLLTDFVRELEKKIGDV